MEDTSSAPAHLDERRRTHDGLAAHLAVLDDDRLAALLAPTNAWRVNGHGNQSGVIDVEGAKVFVKKVALTDLERSAKTEGSTANLFGLPLFYQYGVGSAGFGAGRELRAQLEASGWALSGESPHFPLIHHWRVLARASPPLSVERLARIQRGVDHWEASDAVRARLEAVATAPASIVLFIEYLPQTLQQWLEDRLAREPLEPGLPTAITQLYDQWRAAASFMNERGMLHFDLHSENVLTDGERLYVADFGLALCADFDLSPAERAFFATHRLYDRAYVDWAFVEWLTRDADPPLVLTPGLRAMVDRCAPVADIFGAFFNALHRDSKTTPYPTSELEAAIAAQPDVH